MLLQVFLKDRPLGVGVLLADSDVSHVADRIEDIVGVDRLVAVAQHVRTLFGIVLAPCLAVPHNQRHVILSLARIAVAAVVGNARIVIGTVVGHHYEARTVARLVDCLYHVVRIIVGEEHRVVVSVHQRVVVCPRHLVVNGVGAELVVLGSEVVVRSVVALELDDEECLGIYGGERVDERRNLVVIVFRLERIESVAAVAQIKITPVRDKK